VLVGLDLLCLPLEEVSHPEDDLALRFFLRPPKRLQGLIRDFHDRKMGAVALLVACRVKLVLPSSNSSVNDTSGTCHDTGARRQRASTKMSNGTRGTATVDTSAIRLR